MSVLAKLSLVHRFLAIGFLVLLAGMVIIGTWVGRQIEAGVVQGSGVVTNLYLESAISPRLQSLARSNRLDDADRIALDRLLAGTRLGDHVVALRIWARDGRIVYDSLDPARVGNRIALERPIAQAFAGEVHSRVIDADLLNGIPPERNRARLIETFAPIRADTDNSVFAVAGLYQGAESLAQGVRAAQLRSWSVHGAVTLLMLALLATLVVKANDIINAQRRELSEKVAQLTALLEQNEQLHERVSRAAARTTALNERFLRHISTDLHDGPGQCLALASMRIEALADVCSSCEHATGRERNVAQDFGTVQQALQSALGDLRAILRGFQLPEIENLSLGETLQRAVDEHERKTGVEVPLVVDGLPEQAPLPVRITLYRLLQEALANGFRHGGGRNQRAAVNAADGELRIEVADDGRGFDPNSVNAEGHFGLDGMRERVQVLGGSFEVRSAPNQGTVVLATLPLQQVRERDA